MHPISHMKSFFFPFSRNIFTLLLLFFHFLITDNIFSRQKGKNQEERKVQCLKLSEKQIPCRIFPKWNREPGEIPGEVFLSLWKTKWKVFPRIPRKSRNVLFFMCERERKRKFFLQGRKPFQSAGTFSHEYLIFLFFTKSCWELFFSSGEKKLTAHWRKSFFLLFLFLFFYWGNCFPPGWFFFLKKKL